MSYEIVEAMLARRGVRIDAIAAIVYRLQKGYHPELTLDDCVTSVKSVLQKREVQYTLYTGIALDELAEKKLLPQPLQAIMEADESLYGVDETLALGITHVYGMIGLTSFGYLDKEKIGVIHDLNEHTTAIHVFWMIWSQGWLLRLLPGLHTKILKPKNTPQTFNPLYFHACLLWSI